MVRTVETSVPLISLKPTPTRSALAVLTGEEVGGTEVEWDRSKITDPRLRLFYSRTIHHEAMRIITGTGAEYL